MDWLVASLGDPYNSREFWIEVFRVLKPGGTAIFTTPAYEWATCFRRETESSSSAVMEAEFELMDGTRVRLPSFIYSEEDQLSLVVESGLIVREVLHTTIADLKGEVLSPKLCLNRGSAGPVVTGFLIKKPSNIDGPVHKTQLSITGT
jgi:hypothetical protein